MDGVADKLLNGQFKDAIAMVREYGYTLKEVYKYMEAEGYEPYKVIIIADMMIEGRA